MIIPDINLLIYAYNSDAPHHLAAKSWWERCLNENNTVGLTWVTILGFIRLMTHPSVLERPLTPKQVTDDIAAWLNQLNVQILDPGPRHFEILTSLLQELGVAANLTTDAHLAAIAIEYQAELHSNDVDFTRFPGLRWRNPLIKK